MNNFGQFLYTLRKEKGMTQAELAEALGVTNKAVSKWETDEAMPETSLLLPLSRIFDVTVDELLDGKRQEKSTKENEKEDEHLAKKDIEDAIIKKHLFSHVNDEEKTLLDRVKDAVCAITFLLGLVVYLTLGATRGMWHPYWIIFPACGLLCGIIGITFDILNKEKRKQKIERGENPYTGAICGFVIITCIITYLILGATLNMWHPLWIIPAGGALVCGIIGAIGEIFVYKKRNNKE